MPFLQFFDFLRLHITAVFSRLLKGAGIFIFFLSLNVTNVAVWNEKSFKKIYCYFTLKVFARKFPFEIKTI